MNFPKLDDFPQRHNEYANIGQFSLGPNGSQIGFQTSFHIENWLVLHLVITSLKTTPTILTQMRIGLLKINYLILFYFLKIGSIL
jgi:hypothetical protein